MFLTTLMHKLDSLLSHSLSVNLRLSLVVSLLFYCPLPRVRRLLASATSTQAAPSALMTLAGLWKAGRRRQLRLQSFPSRLAACKQRTAHMGSGGGVEGEEGGGTGVGSGAVGGESLDVETFMQAWLVLEGLVLEVAAISEVEQHQHRLQATAAAHAATVAAQRKQGTTK